MKRHTPMGITGKIVTAVAALLVLVLVAGILLFRVNRFRFVLKLTGEAEMTWEYGEPFEDPGIVPHVFGTMFFENGWTPDVDIQIQGEIDETKLGLQTVTYTAQYHDLTASVSRSVRVVDSQVPVITLHTNPDYTPTSAAPYEEEGYTAFDNRDGDITDRVVREEHFGYVTYTVLDSSGNPAYAQRKIPEYDFIPPEMTLLGDADITIYVGTRFRDPGCTAWDNREGDITEDILTEGKVIWYKKGNYTLYYSARDSFGNVTRLERTVRVVARPGTQTVNPGDKVIYLTFDDGPGPYTGKLLDVLNSYDVKATFFVVDTGYYNMMRRIVNEGHSIAIHSMSHNYSQIYKSEEAYFADIQAMQNLIREQTGATTWLMRFPGGSSNTVSRFNEGIMTRLAEAVQDAGFHYYDWNVDSNDAGGARNATTVFENVVEGVSKQSFSIVLQHDIHAYSVDAVEKIIIWGYENGYTFLPLTAESPTVHHGLNN